MEIVEAKRTAHLRQWTEMIKACRLSGQTVQTWCEANNINTKTYYYRLKQVRLAALKSTESDIQQLPSHTKETPVFAELQLAENDTTGTQPKHASTSPVTITIGQATINIQNEAGPDIIAYAIKAVNEILCEKTGGALRR